ncbi:SDR family oxidoreductase [uncultured Croceitalea sp.]|uniref:SDR family NAD(P)-dependent oxidoreductase n=1 Tax=uncultured Croceitalea sp. TaxID=1798908 RepID=UPI00330568D3
MKTIHKKLADLISLEGKTIVITGAASGIGQATALRIAQANASLVLVDMNEEGLKKTQQLIAAETTGEIHTFILDISNIEAIKQTVSDIDQATGGFYAWLNIAGVFPGASTLEMSEKEWDFMMNINLKGAFFCAQQAAKAMLTHKTKGVIINTITTTIERPGPGLTHYIASKGGVEAMTSAMAREFGAQGIRVLNVSPTMTKTKGMEDQEEGLAMAFGENPFDGYGKELPLRGKVATPDFIARAFLFAVSDLAEVFTGTTLYADSGELLL